MRKFATFFATFLPPLTTKQPERMKFSQAPPTAQELENLTRPVQPKTHNEGASIWRKLDFHQRAVIGYWVTLLTEAEGSAKCLQFIQRSIVSTSNDWRGNGTCMALVRKVNEGGKLKLEEKYYLSAWFVWRGFTPYVMQCTDTMEEIVTRDAATQRNVNGRAGALVFEELKYTENGGRKIVVHSRMNREL